MKKVNKANFKKTLSTFATGITVVATKNNAILYGKTINSKLAILWERRAYGFGLFYNINDDSAGFMFRLNGFDFDGINDSSESLGLVNEDTQSLQTL